MRSRSLAICLQEKVDSKSRVLSGAVLYFTIGEATALSSSTFRMSCQAMPPWRASARLSAIIAADTAKFGQPEITLGTIPGIGGTQRLTRAIGKSKAMDLCLTGRMMDAAEAERSGLVARVVPAASLMDEAMKAAETIAGMSLIAVMTAKQAVNRAFETTLAEGIRFERRTFQALFATHDQKEGMAAFIEKRPPKFENR